MIYLFDSSRGSKKYKFYGDVIARGVSEIVGKGYNVLEDISKDFVDDDLRLLRSCLLMLSPERSLEKKNKKSDSRKDGNRIYGEKKWLKI